MVRCGNEVSVAEMKTPEFGSVKMQVPAKVLGAD